MRAAMSGSASADTCDPMSEMADAVHSLRNAGWRQRRADVSTARSAAQGVLR
jgi:hypothetical protein